LVVVDLADAVAAVLAHHRETLGFGVGLDRVADVAQGRARPDRADAAPHRLERGLDQAPRHHRRGAGVVHAAGVAVPAVLDHGDVDVDDVAVLQDLGFARDAMADDVVDRDAGGLGIAAVADVGRDRALHLHDVVVADAVQFLGAHARLHVRGDHFQHLGGQAAGDAHLLDCFGGLEVHGHGGDYRAFRAPRAARPALPAGRRVPPRGAGLPAPSRPAILPRLCLPPPGGTPTPGAGFRAPSRPANTHLTPKPVP